MSLDLADDRPVLIDLYCCAGGASMGYHRAGFRVIGVDKEPQPRYPFEFHQGDALQLLPALIEQYRPAAVAASPPCRDHTSLTNSAGLAGTGWLLPATIERLATTGLPYVIENVDRADMPGAYTLCGRSFGIARLKRHRQFLVNFPMVVPPCACSPRVQPIGVYGDLRANDRNDNGRIRAGIDTARRLLDCPWMEAHELTQAIPPVYTEHIGGFMLAAVQAPERAA